MSDSRRISTCLWFDADAEEAVAFYASVFGDDLKIASTMRCGEAGPGPKGSVLTIEFQLRGHDFIALNGGPYFKFSEAISIFVACDTQAEIDGVWGKLLEGGASQQCGWLKDKFGLSWQIVPAVLGDMVRDSDARRADRVMRAMLTMIKLDIAALKKAYDGA